MCWRLQIVVGLALWCATTTVAYADKRVALVIGNSGYQNVVQLTNPVRDAAAIADMFKATGFEVVELRRDLTAVDMRRVIRDFSSLAQTADVAVVYFAGHGLEVDGENYLIPIDAKLEHDIDVEDEAISLGRVLQMIQPAKRLRIVILDACRNNPFLQAMNRTLATRAVGRGLARVDPSTSDTLVAFAAKAGSTAIDSEGEHSPFTTALLKNLPVPGVDVRIALGRVRDQVLEATGRKQEPFLYGSLGGDAVPLVPSGQAKQVETASPPPVDSVADERQDYELAERVGTITAWESFLSIHSSGFFAELARGQLARLYAARTEPPPRPSPMAIGSQSAVGAGKTDTDGNSGPAQSRPAATPDHSAAKNRAVAKEPAESRHKYKDEEAAGSQHKHKNAEAAESRHRHKDEETAESHHRRKDEEATERHHKYKNVEVRDVDDERVPPGRAQHRGHQAEEFSSSPAPMLVSPRIPFGWGGIGFGRW